MLNKKEKNILNKTENKEILVAGLEFCLKHCLTKQDSLGYITKTHPGVFEEDVIKHMFDILSKIKKRVPHYLGEAMSKKDVLFQSLGFCITQYFTKEETLNYMAKYHGGLFEEGMLERVFDTMSGTTKNRDPHYEAEVARRSSLRKFLTQEPEWTTKEKMMMIEDRLSLLCQETRAMLGDFSRLEIETLGFFITKLPDEFGDLYARGGTHDICFHCHCFVCYRKFLTIFESFSEKKKRVIDEVMNELDVAEGNQEITQEEEEVKKEKYGAGKKTGGKKTSGKKKSRK